MHVLIFPSWYFPAGTNTISGRMFHHLAQGLREENVDARIFYPDYKFKGPIFKKHQYEIEEGVPTWRTQKWFPPKTNASLFGGWIKKCMTDLKAYVHAEGKPDLIHAQSYHAGAVCEEARKTLDIPYILTERLSNFITGQIADHHKPWIHKAHEHASRITAVSPGLKQALTVFTKRPIEVVPNYFDPANFYVNPTTTKNKAFTFISVGEPAYIKGYDLLLKAFARLKSKYPGKEILLILADAIPEEKELRQLASKLSVGDYITWTGLINQQQLSTLYNQCHVMVSASRIETFGKAILEAQACGIPVLATRTDGANFILESSSQGILVEPENENELLSGMEKMMNDYEHYEPKFISEIVSKRFTKRVVIDQWVEIYNSVRA